MSTLRHAFKSGVVDNNPLTDVGTTLSSTGLSGLPVVASPDILWLVLDPDGASGTPEIVKVTAHTASATTATIVRGQQTGLGGSTGRQHSQNTVWVHPVTPDELNLGIANSATVATSESTSSSTYADLATLGPSVTMETGTLVRVSWVFTADITANSGQTGIAISGATTSAAPAGIPNMGTVTEATLALDATVTNYIIAAVNAGSNTFTLRYKVTGGGSVLFSNRTIVVERLN